MKKLAYLLFFISNIAFSQDKIVISGDTIECNIIKAADDSQYIFFEVKGHQRYVDKSVADAVYMARENVWQNPKKGYTITAKSEDLSPIESSNKVN